MMRTFYNGYHFSRRAEHHVYNPTLALYFLKAFQHDCRYPDEILDINLAMDRGKMHYISRLPEGRRVILDALTEAEPVHVPRLADRFGVEDILYAPKDTGFVVSFLYYFGILTLGGMTPFGELMLTIPNLGIRKLYAESIREMLVPGGESAGPGASGRRGPVPARRAATPVRFRRTEILLRCSATGITPGIIELTVKTAFLTLLFNDTL